MNFFGMRGAASTALMRAQYRAFTRQIPLLYLTLLANSAAVAFTFRSLAPPWLDCYLPIGLGCVCVVRLAMWLRAREREFDRSQLIRRLRVTMILVVVLGAAFTFWGLALYPYGDAYARGHVAFYMGITVIACVFCLMHLRSAALVLAAIVNVPLAVFFLLTGNPVFIAIALNIVLVSGSMIVILLIYYRDFADLVESKEALLTQQRTLQELSDLNHSLANLDPLTALPNRRRFFSDVEALIGSAQNTMFAVGIMDLDGFKQVNDLYGHVAGDRVLVETAQRLRSLVTPSVTVARLGGDEFGIIARDLSNAERFASFCAELTRISALPHTTNGMTTRLSGSLGLAIYPHAGASAEQLFERADFALFHAKTHSRGQAVTFSAEHEIQIRRSSAVEHELCHSDLREELSLMYQPIVDLRTGRVTAFEALARWRNARLGPVAPNEFIRTAEHCGMIHEITLILLEQALAFLRRCPPALSLSFNLSALDVASAEAVDRIVALLAAHRDIASRIRFEVTETAFVRDFELARRAILTLKAHGARVALDDFGTGFSSLSSMDQLPIDCIKIDKSFIDDIVLRERSQSIVKTVFDLCKNLQLECVVEGVEALQQIDVLRTLGCAYVQGYVFSRPLAERDALALDVQSPLRLPAREAAVE